MNQQEPRFSDAWLRWRSRVDLDRYDRRWELMEAAGHAIHGEADFVDRYDGDLVLDGGCGTGRVAVELCRRGRTVTGVDNDPDMIERARAKPEPVRWVLGDLSGVELGGRFDVIVLAGNTLQFVVPELRSMVMTNLASHLAADGVLIMGSSLADGVTESAVVQWASDAGLAEADRFSTWDGDRYVGGDYLLTVHRLAD